MSYLPALPMSYLPTFKFSMPSLPQFSMSYLPALLGSLVAIPLSYGAYKIFLFFYAQWTSPLHVLPGPPNASLIFGHMNAIMKAVCTFSLFDSLLSLIHIALQENSVLHEKWVNEYGSTITYNALFGVRFIGNVHGDILAYAISR